MSDEPEAGRPTPLFKLPSSDLANYPVEVTLLDLLKSTLALVENANLKLTNARQAREIADLQFEKEQLAAQLALAEGRATEAERLFATDTLTGLKRREVIEQEFHAAHAEIVEHRQTAGPLSIIVCDIDHFKNINDTFGHHGGDMALQTVGPILASQKRNSDGLAHVERRDEAGRIGGEEFLILLPNCDLQHAAQIAERMRVKVESNPFVEDKKTGETKVIPFTMSFGVASFSFRIDHRPQDLFKRADAALYVAKENGRNLVCCSDDRTDAYTAYRNGKYQTIETEPKDSLPVRQRLLEPGP
ncbi:MAG: GGDEF domain-containing protein [Pseudomonadota bacterium]|nr:GGDEF domain-containing protein [Pseudomonadota bacterium]